MDEFNSLKVLKFKILDLLIRDRLNFIIYHNTCL